MNETSTRQPEHGKGVTDEDWIKLGNLLKAGEGMSRRLNHQKHIAATRIQGQPKNSMSEKKEKERFLMFTRVLMKYLEVRDAEMHARAKQVIRECYERNKRGDAAYKSLTQSMKSHLRTTVGDAYWKKAHGYLDPFFKQKQKSRSGEQRQEPGASTGGDPKSNVSSASARQPPKETPASAPTLAKKLNSKAIDAQQTVSELDDGANANKKKRMKLGVVERSAHDLFQKDSECPLCLEILVKTVSIHPCGHSFCSECAETHLKSTSSTAATANASSKKTECPTCKSEIYGFNRNRALDTMIWAAALTGTFEADDASNYLMRIEQAGERVATKEEKECILRRAGN